MGTSDGIEDVQNAGRQAMRGFGMYGRLRNASDGSEEIIYLIPEDGREINFDQTVRELEEITAGTCTWVVRLTPAFMETDEETGQVRVLSLVEGVH